MRIIKFIGLKVLEIGGLVFLYWISGVYCDFIVPLTMSNRDIEMMAHAPEPMKSLWGFMFLLLTGLIFFGIGWFIKKNWEWSGK